MDIMELSRKLEADLLESHSSCKETAPNNFSPRITRSQLNNAKPPPTVEWKPEIESPPKRRHRKVDEVEEIYLNKKVRVVHKNLETIYEDPIWKKGSTMLLGTSKVKRSIYLDREFRITSKQKSKMRKKKIKRLGKRMKIFKISDDEFRNRMSRIDSYINGNEIEVDQEFGTADESNNDGKDSHELNE